MRYNLNSCGPQRSENMHDLLFIVGFNRSSPTRLIEEMDSNIQ